MIQLVDILNSLNEKQRLAVETIYGPVLVIAGPGSGKTQLLAARIAYILSTTDYLPSNILCLTFTENAAQNMRERLVGMIGQDAYRVAIHTFHSFGSEIINRYRYLSKEYNDAKPVDTIESSHILDAILESLPWDNPYKPGFRSSDTIREVLGNIGSLKKGGITPETYRTILQLNIQSIKKINPIIEKYWEQIDSLGQKKEDKEKKIVLFEEFTKIVQEMSENVKNIWNYEDFETLIQRSLDEAWSTYEGNTNTKYMNAWRDAWTEKNHTGKRELKETSKLKKQLALADIYEKYQLELEKRGLIDFSDMILEAIRLAEENEIVRMNLAETYQFIMIDEFQDTNESQMRLIQSIISVNMENPNIFAVGDDDQSIYKFQGANTKNIRDFHDKYSDTELIILEKNYRSKEEIIITGRSVIKSQMNNIGTIFPGTVKKFDAIRGNDGIVKKYKFKNELEEISWIIDDIADKIREGTPPSQIAIITKKNKTLELIAKGLLEKKLYRDKEVSSEGVKQTMPTNPNNIPISLSKDESIFDTESVRLVVNILKVIDSLNGTYNQENAELIVSVIFHPCFDIDRLTLWNIAKEIYHARKESTRSWIEVLASQNNIRIKNFANFLRELSIRSQNERLEDIIDYITGANMLSLPDEYDDNGETNPLQIQMFSETKEPYTSPLYSFFFEQLLNNNGIKVEYTRHLANIRKFVESIRSYKNGKGYISLSDAIELLELIEKYTIKLEVSHIVGVEKNAVNLITVYKAKGLEWKHVYVPCLTSSEYKLGKIGGSSLPKNLPLEAERDNDEDIERLIYTAITRAKDSLTLSFSGENMDEKTLEPLPCIDAGDGSWIENTITPLESLRKTLEVEKKDLFSLPYLGEENEFLRDRIEKIFVMNATALQNFLNIVDAGPEKFISQSLLRFPQAKNISASFGSAIHKALEDFLSDYSKNGTFMKSLLFKSFEETLKKEGFDKKVENDYLERGKENLEYLYSDITKTAYGELRMEEDFRTAGGGTWLGDIQITGKIDRIEKLPDDSLIITDYKTGRGFDTFDGRGTEHEKIKQWKYRLQLAFYAVLFELSPRWKIFRNKRFELFFVERNRDEERFHRVVEYIHEGEIERTQKLIIAVMTRIRNLDFPDISKYPKTVEGIRMFEEELLSGQI